MSNRFRVVGYLIPSGTGKSYKVIIDEKFVGLIPKEALVRSLQARPMLVVEISKFVDQPFEDKPTEQRTLNNIAVADPEKLEISEGGS